MENNEVHDHTEGEEKTRSGLASDKLYSVWENQDGVEMPGSWEVKCISGKLNKNQTQAKSVMSHFQGCEPKLLIGVCAQEITLGSKICSEVSEE